MINSKPIDLFIRIGLISFLVVYCYEIFKPFIALMLWSIILAVALYPLHALIARKMGGKQGRAATVLVLLILLGVLVPTTLLAISFADSTIEFVKEVQNGTLQVPAPPDSVATWPLVGGKLHDLWSAAHTDIGSFVAKYEPKIGVVTKQILAYAASAGTAILKFLVSLVVAGIWMAYGSPGHAAAKAIAKRMAGPAKGMIWSSFRRQPSVPWRKGSSALPVFKPCYWGRGLFWWGFPPQVFWHYWFCC